MSPRIVLASTSRYRHALMDRLQLPFETCAPPFEERVPPGAEPRPTIEAFARGKAQSLDPTYDDAFVIGSDQGLVTNDGEWLGKPGTVPAACAQLRHLAGGTHALVTAVAVWHAASETLHEATDVTRLHFRALTDAEIESYVRLDAPLDCAGSFKIESLGIMLFERVDGDDPTAIMGLPLIRLRALLEAQGVRVLDRRSW